MCTHLGTYGVWHGLVVCLNGKYDLITNVSIETHFLSIKKL
jgi:hypothetical protein